MPIAAMRGQVLDRLPDKNCRQVGEYESLDKRHQYLNQVNKYGKPDGDRGKAPADPFIQLSENKDQGNQADDNNMPCHHIGKKTYDQRERLGKDPDEFYQDHNGFDGSGNGRVHDMGPIMLIRTYRDHDKGYHAQHQGERYIPGYVGRAGHHPEEGIDQYKEKNG